MLDVLVRGGQVVDGTGAPRRTADVGIRDGRVVAIGAVDEPAARVVDADGLLVAPGFLDIHTHFDVQGFWDTTLSPSPLHGVTTVVGGNCGFSVAPLTERDADYLMRMLARVEGMPLTSLERGVPWNWRTTAEYLDALDGTLAINAGFLVGHSAIRRVVMGAAATERAATEDEVAAMEDLLRRGLAAGALGFSSSTSSTHSDADGNLVPSCHADDDELVSLAAVCGDYPGTSLEFMPGARAGGPASDSPDLMTRMSLAAQRPINWNVLIVHTRNLDANSRLAGSDRARAHGARVVGLHMPKQMEARVSLGTGIVFESLPGWHDPMALPRDAKLALLRDPAGRARLRAAADTGPATINYWPGYRVEQVFTPSLERYEGRFVEEIAAEVGKDAFDTLLDIACADALETIFLMPFPPDNDEVWQVRSELFRDGRTVVGASDAGAHLDSIGTFDYATSLLSVGVRERQVLTTEEAVHLLTQVPAIFYGIRDRGVVAEGAHADLVLFDEAEVGTERLRMQRDLPGDAPRLFAAGSGIEHVLVNGEPIVTGGAFTDARPGTVLRSGRDTVTPSLEG